MFAICATAVGHPAGGKFGAVHFIVRATMRPDGFDLVSIADDGSVARQTVRCDELRAVQNHEIAHMLRRVVRALEEENQMHKARFRGARLAPDIERLSYQVGKIFETADAMHRGPIGSDQAMGTASLD